MKFDPLSVKRFRFVSWNFDEENSRAKFFYAFDDGPLFEETLEFHGADLPLSPLRRSALTVCLKNLHLILGISYYKAAVPGEIVIEGTAVSKDTARFFEKLYLNGLGEFAYRNRLNLRDRIRFPFSSNAESAPHYISLPRRTAIPVGGGKDSVVTMDALKSAGEPVLLFSLGSFKPIRDVAEASGLPYVSVSRRISPLLFELNEKGAYNGHVPISAIIAFILPAAAVLYGFDMAALSNERSANKGNVIAGGLKINHQYSKSHEFELDVSEFIKKHVLADFLYFSFLRPLSDIGIARLFAGIADYHFIFMSCNSAFRIDQKKRGVSWCLNCPKCRFTFLALAPFMEKEALVSMFGANLLDDERQINGFDELTGIRGHKPFDCVGETSEALAAFAMLEKMPEWSRCLLVRRFSATVSPGIEDPEKMIREALNFSDTHNLPNIYEETLRAYSDCSECA